MTGFKGLFDAVTDNMELMSGLSFKCFKKYKGRGGEPLTQGDLYIDGVKSVFVSEGDSMGAPLTMCDYVQGSSNRICDYLKESKFTDDGIAVDADYYLRVVLAAFDLFAHARRLKKRKTVIFHPKTDALRVITVPVTDKRVFSYVKENYGGDWVILSEFV